MFCWNVLWSTVLIFVLTPVAVLAAANRAPNAALGIASEPLEPTVTALLLLLEHADNAGIPRALTPARPTAPRRRDRREGPETYGEFCAEDMELLLWVPRSSSDSHMDQQARAHSSAGRDRCQESGVCVTGLRYQKATFDRRWRSSLMEALARIRVLPCTHLVGS